MPGFFPHLIAGFALFLSGRFIFRSYFEEKNKTKDSFILLIVCLVFTFIPDMFLIIYYVVHLLPFRTLVNYHIFTHLIIIPIAIVALIIINFLTDIKRKPIWTMGLISIIVHIIMDLFISDTSIWI